jgi:hypothetical protein
MDTLRHTLDCVRQHPEYLPFRPDGWRCITTCSVQCLNGEISWNTIERMAQEREIARKEAGSVQRSMIKI